jgi:tetratricopeptide (TPR) repeat protein
VTAREQPAPLEDAVAAFTQATDDLAAGRITSARAAMATAVRLLTDALGATAPDIANARLGAVQIERAAGDLRAARTHAAAAVAVATTWSLEDPDDVALRLDAECCLAVCDQELGDLDGAERRLLAALELAAGAAAGDDSVLKLTNALGVTYKFAGRLDDAWQRYQEAYALILRADPPDPETLAALYHNLAGLAHSRGEAEAGIAWAQRGIAMRRAHGLEGLALARDLGGLGALQHLDGDLDAAQASYAAAERAFLACLPPDHPELGVLCANQAALAADRGTPVVAIESYRRAERLLTAALGPQHADVQVVRRQLHALAG